MGSDLADIARLKTLMSRKRTKGSKLQGKDDYEDASTVDNNNDSNANYQTKKPLS